MAITKKETAKIAGLARLDLNEKEIVNFTEQLSSVLDNFKKLNEVNTDGVEPTSQVTGLYNIGRKDNPILDWKTDPDLKKNKELLLKNLSPNQKEKEFIKVPGVFLE